MNGIFNTSTIETFKKIRTGLLRTAIWIFIAGAVVGAMLILMGSSGSAKAIAQVMGTLFVLALAMIISSNNFYRLEKGDKTVQILALIGLVFNLVWAFLWVLLIWEVFKFFNQEGFHYAVSIFAKLAMFSSYISGLGFFGSNIMSIKEGAKRNIVHPLKITALICLSYECAYFAIFTLVEANWSEPTARLGLLAIFAGFIWVISSIIALIFSSQGRKTNDNANQQPVASSDDQLRAEIEEKVRREMIEKEVRAKMEKEAAEKPEPSQNAK